MARESTQKKVGRVRPPRVQITYEVETLGAMEKKELPFVVGVLGDFSGKPDEPLPKMADRKFVEIDRDNFDAVLAGSKPRLTFRVDDKLSGKEDSQLNVELRFKSIEDFEPENVVKQIEPMRKLLEARNRLKDLQARMDGNDKLEELLEDVLKSTDAQAQLKKGLGVEGSDSEGSPE
jgi:type VI secretion system protein ImpB